MEGIRRTLADNEKDAAYEYLCRLEEAKRWIEELIGESLPPSSEFEDSLANGVYLCKLGMKLLPNNQQWKKVYDLDQSKYQHKGLDFRHTDNINFFLDCLPSLGLSKVFYPCVTDIFERKNTFKLVYCLHALSHLLCKQGKTKVAVNGYAVSPVIDEDILRKASLTLREGNITFFDVVESLVEEELQYAQIGITDRETMEEEEAKNITLHPVVNGNSAHGNNSTGDNVKTENRSSTGTEEVGMFDDPKYFFVSGSGVPMHDESETKTTPSSLTLQPILRDLKCQGGGISVSLYNGFKGQNDGNTKEFMEALKHINECLGRNNPKEMLKALQNPNANLPFPYLEATNYYSALVREREEGLPSNTTAVYTGLKRSLCDTLLDKLRPGAYLLRHSTTLGNGEFVFSFRNQVGIKHWKLSINKEGKFSWDHTHASFDSLESFLQHFVVALGKVTKLFVYPGTAFMLKINTSALLPEQLQTLKKLREEHTFLSYGQIAYVISDVNSRIRRERASSREVQPPQVNRRGRTSSNSALKQEPPKSLDILDEDEDDDDAWNMTMILKVNRRKADELLEKEGHPGSFLVRPSENKPGDFALAFRTRSDTRRWRIVQSKGKFFVHPRPNPYNSLFDIIKHFRGAVGAETGLTMSPLIPSGEIKTTRNNSTSSPITETVAAGSPDGRVPPLRKQLSSDVPAENENIPPIPPRRLNSGKSKSSTIDVMKPTASMSRLNPANITSWSVDDVCQWLFLNGLGKFTEVFQDNCVDGECLLTLDNNLLKDDLKITQLGYRSKILKRVDALKMSQYNDQLHVHP